MAKSDVFRQEQIPTSQGQSKVVRRPLNVPRHNIRYTVKTVKQSDSVIVWASFSGTHLRERVKFSFQKCYNVGANYLKVLNNHLLLFWGISSPLILCRMVPQHTEPNS